MKGTVVKCESSSFHLWAGSGGSDSAKIDACAGESTGWEDKDVTVESLCRRGRGGVTVARPLHQRWL